MIGRVENKIALVTGGGSGLGRATVQALAREGAKVLVADLNLESAHETVTMVAETGGEASAFAMDVTVATQVEAMVQTTVERYGRLDCAFNNAGIPGKVGTSVIDYEEEDWDRVIAVDLKGVWLGMKYTMPEIAKRGGGSIVITSSTAGIRAVPRLSPYIASKHAVIGLMRSGAMEGAKDKIRVNTVNPSPIDTQMITRLEDVINPNRGNAQPMADTTPLRRYGEPEEVARLMLFLGSEEGSFCTGGVYMVDGGVSAGRS